MARAGGYRPLRKGVAQLLVGPEIKKLVTERAELALAMYRDRVRVRTGVNRADARVTVELGGKGRDPVRWVGVVTAYSPHAVAREFGNRRVRHPDRALASVVADLDEKGA